MRWPGIKTPKFRIVLLCIIWPPWKRNCSRSVFTTWSNRDCRILRYSAWKTPKTSRPRPPNNRRFIEVSCAQSRRLLLSCTTRLSTGFRHSPRLLSRPPTQTGCKKTERPKRGSSFRFLCSRGLYVIDSQWNRYVRTKGWCFKDYYVDLLSTIVF